MPATRSQESQGAMSFLKIVNHGKSTVFAKKVKEDDFNVVKREYEFKDEKRVAFENHFSDITGKIESVYFNNGEYGEELVIKVKDDNETFQINLGVPRLCKSSMFAYDFLKKLPNVNLTKDVTLKPYDFVTKDTGKTRTGISLSQDGVKLTDAYYDFKNKKNLKKNTPPFLKAGSSSDDKTLHNIETKKFYKNELSKLKFEKDAPDTKQEEKKTNKNNNSDDLPF